MFTCRVQGFSIRRNEDEIYGVYGFGRNDFVVRTLSTEVGCIEDKSVQEKDGALYWLSRRGIEKMGMKARQNFGRCFGHT